jgi:hypothetical protein
MVETADAHSHRGDPPVFLQRCLIAGRGAARFTSLRRPPLARSCPGLGRNGRRRRVSAGEYAPVDREGLRREPAADDGRGLYAVLTADGNALLRRMWPVYSRALREKFVSAISAEEAALIAAALGRVNEPRERAVPANKSPTPAPAHPGRR